MKQLQSKQPGRKYLALACLLPFLGYSLVMLVSRYSPFGSSSILYSDMTTNIIPFLWNFVGSFDPVDPWFTIGT